MFEISDDAMNLLLARLEDAMEGRPELRRNTVKAGLRLNFGRRGAYLSLAFPRPTDEVMTHKGKTLLIIDRLEYSRLADSCLMVEHGPKGKTLSMAPRTPCDLSERSAG